MPVNLLNEQDLNTYLDGLVWGEDSKPYSFLSFDNQAQVNFSDLDYVEQNQGYIARMILAQYMKHRMRAYLTDKEDFSFLTPVRMRPGLPKWAGKALSGNQKVFEFDASKITHSFCLDVLLIRDFLYAAAQTYVCRSIRLSRSTNEKIKIRTDYLKTSNEYKTFEKVLEKSKVWQENVLKKGREDQKYRSSVLGTKFEMHLSGGLSVYRLLTPEALDYEGARMGHCLGEGDYDEDLKGSIVELYSIRDKNGEPHATLEVDFGKVLQCKGKGDKPVVAKYIAPVRQFIKQRQYEIRHDLKNVGLIQQSGQLYSLYDLPTGFVFDGDLDLSYMDLSGMNLNISVTGKLNLSRTKNLSPVLDFSRIREVDLSNVDLDGVQELRASRDKMTICFANHMPRVLDFSPLKDLSLEWVNLSGVEKISWPRERVCFKEVSYLPEMVDFSSLLTVDLYGTDCSTVKEMRFPRKEVNLSWAHHLPKRLDFSNTQKVNLYQTDLSGVEEIICAQNNPIDLSCAGNLHATVRFVEKSPQVPVRKVVKHRSVLSSCAQTCMERGA